ncbi:MAG: AEC family transporter [Kiloniellaceae bacterium]
MLNIALSIAPIFILIVLGHLLRRGGIPSFEFWNLNDKLVYWVLMPALLFTKTSTIELAPDVVGAYAVVILGGFAASVIFGLAASKLAGLNGPVASSVLQGAARHNTFIALAVAERLYGADGLAIAAVATSLLIPTTNVTMVTAMVWLVRGPDEKRIVRSILRDLARNPLILSVGAGVAWNAFGSGEIPVLHDVTRILGAAALPVVLLCVGANIRIRAMAASALPLAISSLGKLVVFPLAILVLARLMHLSETETLIALLFGAVPTASSAYTLARQLGGDAPLMAAIVTVQTAIAFVTLPLSMVLAERLLG